MFTIREITNRSSKTQGGLATGLAFLFLWGSLGPPLSAEVTPQATKGYVSLLGGGGVSFPGWGSTARVETRDCLLRLNFDLRRRQGRLWYRFLNELWVEVPLMEVLAPYPGIITSLNFLSGMIFRPEAGWNPYLYFGGGPLYTTASIPGMGAKLCGNYLAGAGCRLRLGGGVFFNIELRYHHISNMGLASPNDPVNSLKILAGFSY